MHSRQTASATATDAGAGFRCHGQRDPRTSPTIIAGSFASRSSNRVSGGRLAVGHADGRDGRAVGRSAAAGEHLYDAASTPTAESRRTADTVAVGRRPC